MFIIQQEENRKGSRKSVEIITVVILALMAVFIIFNARQLEYSTAFGPGSGFMPFWLGVCMLICCAIISWNIYKNFFMSQDRNGEALFKADRIVKVAQMISLIIIVALLFPIIGALPVIGAYMLIVLRWMSGHKWATSLMITIGFTAAVYFVFGIFLNVPLPLGVFSFLK